ncbi:unnamed protein product [Caretta caretta]
MIIAASIQAEHDQILKKVMARAQAENIKLNPDKIQFIVKEDKYMGRILSSQGIRPDDNKVEDTVNMKPPRGKKALWRILGIIRFLAQCILGEASLTPPLRQPLHENITWQRSWEYTATAKDSTL